MSEIMLNSVEENNGTLVFSVEDACGNEYELEAGRYSGSLQRTTVEYNADEEESCCEELGAHAAFELAKEELARTFEAAKTTFDRAHTIFRSGNSISTPRAQSSVSVICDPVEVDGVKTCEEGAYIYIFNCGQGPVVQIFDAKNAFLLQLIRDLYDHAVEIKST
jgi:hypothetical protein